ncbi:MAG: response regulator [Actinomycetota bacterium]|nr:response regulator [Actinomycetota bacterium]
MTRPPIRVLVVDDDYRVAGIHAAYVNRTEGFEVIAQAHTASEARALTASQSPDLILMDIYLPDGNGLDVVRKLLKQPQSPDVIVISAARDLDAIRKAMQIGALHYLVKPFAHQALTERLNAYRKLHNYLNELSEAPEQKEVDKLFELLRSPEPISSPRAKGHSAPTLELVRDTVRACAEDISAAEVSEQIGISRPTAQRCLTYLERHNVVTLNLRYGATGRPEHRYRITTT